jgi:hypothetical protein
MFKTSQEIVILQGKFNRKFIIFDAEIRHFLVFGRPLSLTGSPTCL